MNEPEHAIPKNLENLSLMIIIKEVCMLFKVFFKEEKQWFYGFAATKVIFNEKIMISLKEFVKEKKNATRCNNQDDLPHRSFVLKISLFSEASLELSRASMMQFFLRK